eukprot:tig00021582_g22641.t1
MPFYASPLPSATGTRIDVLRPSDQINARLRRPGSDTAAFAAHARDALRTFAELACALSSQGAPPPPLGLARVLDGSAGAGRRAAEPGDQLAELVDAAVAARPAPAPGAPPAAPPRVTDGADEALLAALPDHASCTYARVPSARPAPPRPAPAG